MAGFQLKPQQVPWVAVITFIGVVAVFSMFLHQTTVESKIYIIDTQLKQVYLTYDKEQASICKNEYEKTGQIEKACKGAILDTNRKLWSKPPFSDSVIANGEKVHILQCGETSCDVGVDTGKNAGQKGTLPKSWLRLKE